MDIVRARRILEDPLLRKIYNQGFFEEYTLVNEDDSFKVDWAKIGTYRKGTPEDTIGFSLFLQLCDEKKELEIATTTYTVAYKKGYTQCQKDMFEEAELKDWDVTLNDGLENEPYVSDDFQIGPDGAYEHTEDITPREKASELIVNYQTTVTSLDYNEAKQCALVALDEIIKECYNWNGSDNVQWETKRFNYWNDVKQEIKNL